MENHIISEEEGNEVLELNINSPAYFTQHYGVDEGVYQYCQKCYEYFKDKEYSKVLKIIGICPQCVPEDLYQQGRWKEQVRFIGNVSCANIDIRIDFDQYYHATSEEKVAIMRNTILKAVKKVSAKGKFDYESFSQDLHDILSDAEVMKNCEPIYGFKKVLLTGFRNTSSEQLVKRADCKCLILPNDKVLDAQILLTELEKSTERVKYIFSFGQKTNIKDKVYIETAARNGNIVLSTDFTYETLQDALRMEKIAVRISDHAGTSFCNALYWNVLEYLRDHGLQTKIVFLHIPFSKNMTAPGDFCERILKGIGNYLQNSEEL